MFRHPSNDAYWLSADDEKRLGSISRSMAQILTTKCAWNDDLEREVFAGKRPFQDLTRMWKCRADATRAQAHRALLAASRQIPARGKPAVVNGSAHSPGKK
jgi:hypothetical protein